MRSAIFIVRAGDAYFLGSSGLKAEFKKYLWHFDQPSDCIPKSIPVAAVPTWEIKLFHEQVCSSFEF